MTQLTLAEAARVKGHFVYGLHDSGGLFYVGRTRNAAGRFESYLARAQRSWQSHLLRRMRAAGDSLRVEILNYMPADLLAAELDAIRQHADRIVNRAGNPLRLETSHLAAETMPSRHRLAPCPACDGPMDGRVSAWWKPYCNACHDRFVRNRGIEKARARALSELAQSNSPHR